MTVDPFKAPLRKGHSNQPHVLNGHGLLDDDEDDDDFPIDLHQWNENLAFRKFISGKDQDVDIFNDNVIIGQYMRWFSIDYLLTGREMDP